MRAKPLPRRIRAATRSLGGDRAKRVRIARIGAVDSLDGRNREVRVPEVCGCWKATLPPRLCVSHTWRSDQRSGLRGLLAKDPTSVHPARALSGIGRAHAQLGDESLVALNWD